MKKDTPIVVFYILYFSWLFTVTYLSPDLKLINLFTAGIIFFYFAFLRERGDLAWFSVAFLGAILGKVAYVESGKLKFAIDTIPTIPLWLPVAWGTTVVALRKFFILTNVARS